MCRTYIFPTPNRPTDLPAVQHLVVAHLFDYIYNATVAAALVAASIIISAQQIPSAVVATHSCSLQNLETQNVVIE